MLKIIDNTDLEILTEFKFKMGHFGIGKNIRKYMAYDDIYIYMDNREIELIGMTGYCSNLEPLFDLIKAGLVEKVVEE